MIEKKSLQIEKKLLILTIMLLALTGCMRRRMTINSNPPGAMVYIDDYEIGTTPVSTNFTYYGTRNIRLEMDGYETLNVKQPVKAPWYQWPGIDFFADNVAPCEINDHRRLNFNMTPQKIEQDSDIVERGEQLKNYQAPVMGDYYGNNGAVLPNNSVVAPAYNNPQNGYNGTPSGSGSASLQSGNPGWAGGGSSWGNSTAPPAYSAPGYSNSIADQPGVLPAGDETSETN